MTQVRSVRGTRRVPAALAALTALALAWSAAFLVGCEGSHASFEHAVAEVCLSSATSDDPLDEDVHAARYPALAVAMSHPLAPAPSHSRSPVHATTGKVAPGLHRVPEAPHPSVLQVLRI
ncbi:hypothetical protein [Spirillospora sp. CA-294931]|uniref:hypothetical protein n=1 Tax=Spirillospora sp. CA-294931 TaxID=3240042 RepID=UPI003D8BDE97